MKGKYPFRPSALPEIGPDAFPPALLHRTHAGVHGVDRLQDAAAHLPELADGGRRVGGTSVVAAAAAAVGLKVIFVGVGSRLEEGVKFVVRTIAGSKH